MEVGAPWQEGHLGSGEARFGCRRALWGADASDRRLPYLEPYLVKVMSPHTPSSTWSGKYTCWRRLSTQRDTKRNQLANRQRNNTPVTIRLSKPIDRPSTLTFRGAGPTPPWAGQLMFWNRASRNLRSDIEKVPPFPTETDRRSIITITPITPSAKGSVVQYTEAGRVLVTSHWSLGSKINQVYYW